MAETAIIDWNFRNWVTIVLMAAFGYALVAFVSSFLGVKSKKAAANA